MVELTHAENEGRRRGRARAIIEWWNSTDAGDSANAYVALENRLVAIQRQAQEDVSCGYTFTDHDGRVYCGRANDMKVAQAAQAVALNHVIAVRQILHELILALEKGFVPEEAIIAFRKAQDILSEE
jgi:hypothetical protein